MASSLVLLLAQSIAAAHDKDRALTYTFKQGRVVVTIVVAEHPSGPEGVVVVWQLANLSQKQNSFHVTQAQFNRIWSMFMSSGADKYPFDPSSREIIDLDYYYHFASAGRGYVVLKRKASQTMIALVTQLQRYANWPSQASRPAPETSARHGGLAGQRLDKVER